MNTLYNIAPPPADSKSSTSDGVSTGALIINADDWGRDQENTERIKECFLRGTVSSVSAMVFMQDSERAAAIAREKGIDAGLHLNFTTPFSADTCPAALLERQREIAAYLWRHRLARAIYNYRLRRAFEYVFACQMEEFHRLYGRTPGRLDGHHHMHLCANVLRGKLLPAGTIVRRSESFLSSEKGLFNRLYRKLLDRAVVQRHRVTDYFFALAPLDPPGRLQRIFSLGRRFFVELETHPVGIEEYRFLMDEEILTKIGNVRIARRYELTEGKTRL